MGTVASLERWDLEASQVPAEKKVTPARVAHPEPWAHLARPAKRGPWHREARRASPASQSLGLLAHRVSEGPKANAVCPDLTASRDSEDNQVRFLHN